MTRPAVLAVALAVLLPTLWRARPPPPSPRRCAPEGRGAPPRGWIGCAGDRGAPRPLAAAERLASGLPLDVNAATAEDLAAIPGLSRALARAVVEDRSARGPYRSLDDLLRVRGIGPARLARSRAHLFAGAAQVE